MYKSCGIIDRLSLCHFCGLCSLECRGLRGHVVEMLFGGTIGLGSVLWIAFRGCIRGLETQYILGVIHGVERGLQEGLDAGSFLGWQHHLWMIGVKGKDLVLHHL